MCSSDLGPVSGGSTLCGWGIVKGNTLTMPGVFTSIDGVANTTGIAQFGLPRPPSSPARPTATAGDHRVSLAWPLVAANGTAIIDYRVQYRREGTSTWKTFADGLRTGRTAVVTGLRNGVRYEFRVAGRNNWITGSFSPVVRATPSAG